MGFFSSLFNIITDSAKKGFIPKFYNQWDELLHKSKSEREKIAKGNINQTTILAIIMTEGQSVVYSRINYSKSEFINKIKTINNLLKDERDSRARDACNKINYVQSMIESGQIDFEYD